MIPLILELKNFLSYGEPQIINFTDHNLICLAGKNGHGKSAILDSMTWALWGQARKPSGTAKPDETLLKVGQNKMLVILDFEVNGIKYKIRREFVKSVNRSIANLDFFIWCAERREFIGLTDKTIRQTQHKINQALKIDFETFVNSSFLRQGNSSEFSKKNPRERKNLLAKILGLEKFDSFQQKSNELLRENKLLQKETESFRENNNIKILEKEGLLITLAGVQQKLVFSLSMKTNLQEIKSLLEEKRIKLNLLIEEISSLVKEKEVLSQSSSSWCEKFNLTAKNIREIQKALFGIINLKVSEEELRKAQDSFLLAEKQLLEKSSLNQLLFRLKKEFEDEEKNKNRSFYEEEKRLNMLHQECFLRQENNLVKLQQEIDAVGILDKKKLEIILKKEGFINELEQLNNLNKIRENYEKKKEKFSAQLIRFKLKSITIKNLEKQQELVLMNKNCPVCTQKLDKIICFKIENHKKIFQRQLKKLSETILSIILEIDKNGQELSLVLKKISHLTSIEKELENINSKLQETDSFLLKKNDLLESLKKETEELSLKLNKLTLEKELLEKNYQHKTVEQSKNEELINGISAKLLELQNIEIDFENSKNNFSSLEQLIKKKQEEDLLLNEKKVLWLRFFELKQLCKNSQKSLNQVVQKIGNSDKVKSEYFSLKIEYQNNQQKLVDEEKNVTVCLQEEATVLQQIKFLEELEKKNILLSEEIDILKAQAASLEIISEGFGKDGIQALLIEEMLPEIEEASNDILDLVSETHAKIFIEPLRDLKKGGLKESLDIVISDQNGIRDYEMFSGGEAFRIDFALRIGISQVIARRAGAPLKTLIIDEGFGALDEEGISLIMNCIYKISNLFSKIIIVSHLQNVKEMFPVHILVNKIAGSSTVSIEYRG